MVAQESNCSPLRRVLASIFSFACLHCSCAIRSVEHEVTVSIEGSLHSSNASSSALEVMKLLRQSCGRFSADNWKAPTSDKCSVLMFRCTPNKNEEVASNHNYGDLSWGLSTECRSYGKYLKIYYVEFARAWLSYDIPYDGGHIYGRASFSQCNGGPNGFVCGCGMHGTSCGTNPKKTRKDANHFGWRIVPDITHWSAFHNYDTCPCVQYALPKRAEGEVDAKKTKEFIKGSGLSDRSNDAYYQWKQVGKPRTVEFAKCIDKYVKKGTGSIEEIVANFQSAVLDKKEKACST